MNQHKIIEALLYSRGMKMEEGTDDEFSFKKLIKWF